MPKDHTVSLVGKPDPSLVANSTDGEEMVPKKKRYWGRVKSMLGFSFTQDFSGVCQKRTPNGPQCHTRSFS